MEPLKCFGEASLALPTVTPREGEDPRMDEARVEHIIGQLENLPTLPAVATRLLGLTARASKANAPEVGRIIQSDQTLTARVLRLVNSPHYSLGRPIGTVAEAVVLMGFEAIHNSVLSIQVFDMFAQDQESTFDRRSFWKHAVGVGCCAELLSEYLGGKERDQAFVAGLLHDIGKVALDVCFPADFARAMELVRERGMPSVVAEQREIGADHTLVGKRLAEAWRLPDDLTRSIWLHHQPLSLGDGNSSAAARSASTLVKLVHISDVICGQQHIGFDEGRPTFLASEALLDQVGIIPETLDKVTRALRQRIEARAKVLGLDEADEVSLFVEAIQSANVQLGRINQRLQHLNGQLRLRVKRFAALNEMNTRILPSTDLEEALTAAAETLRRCLDAQHAVCYVHDEDQQVAVASVSTAGGPETEVIRLPWPARPEGRTDPPSEAWIIQQLPRDFGTGRVYAMPLAADGRTIGGAVINTSPRGLATRSAVDQMELSAIVSSAAMSLAKALLRNRLVHQAEQLARANRDLERTYGELLEMQKLKAVATMAAGAAHEINNPLAIISGRAQFLRSRETDPRKQQELDLISEQSTRISRIISDLMAYARPSEPNLRSMDLNEVAQRTMSEVSLTLADRQLDLQQDLVEPGPQVRADPDQLRALVGELAAALAAALQPGAGIRISTHAHTLADSAELRVATVGAALPAEALPSVFEPFFSPSLRGHGFGLAFAKCQSGIKKMGGDIWVDADDGRSTRFRIVLPLAG